MEAGLLNLEAALSFVQVLFVIGVISMATIAFRIYGSVCGRNRDLRLSKHILDSLTSEERHRVLLELEKLS